MNFLKRLKGSKTFSARSQASYRREAELQKRVSAVREKLRHSQSVIDGAQAKIEQLTSSVTQGESWAAELIPQSATRVRAEKDKIDALEPVRAEIQSQIDALTEPSAAEREARAEHQKALAELALERLEVDRALAKAAQTLQGILEKRAEMTGRMGELIGKIDFTLASDGLDQSRFDALRTSLGQDIEGASEEWVDCFLGDNQTGRTKTEPHIVRDEVVFVEETLANPGVFRCGEQVDLTAKQAEKLHLGEKCTMANLVEKRPDGSVHSGRSYPVREVRIERIAGGISSVYQRG